MERDSLVHARDPDGTVAGLGDMRGQGFDARKTVVLIEKHVLQQTVVCDVEPVGDGHDEKVVVCLANRAYRVAVALYQYGGVVAYGVEVFTRSEKDFAIRIDGHGRTGNAAVRHGDVPTLSVE